jgi:hypothetical protein
VRAHPAAGILFLFLFYAPLLRTINTNYKA